MAPFGHLYQFRPSNYRSLSRQGKEERRVIAGLLRGIPAQIRPPRMTVQFMFRGWDWY